MKNQYFADINDYRKYGLLRILAGNGAFKIVVCWMLTPDDGRNNGGYVSYLAKPAKWRYYDPELYDHATYLQECCAEIGTRWKGQIGVERYVAPSPAYSTSRSAGV